MEEYVLRRNISLFGGSFNPVGRHHVLIVRELVNISNRVIIIPCGLRPDKETVNGTKLEHRRNMVKLAFSGISGATFDFDDLDYHVYRPTYELQSKYEEYFPHDQIWHTIGADLVVGGGDGKSEIQKIWDKGEEIWHTLHFLIILRPGYTVRDNDLPPYSAVVEIPGLAGSSTMIRNRVSRGELIDDLVTPEIGEYIRTHGLYK